MKMLALITLMATAFSASAEDREISEKIIALEKAALERWMNGDVYGYLELYADDVTYFDPMLEKRLDGLNELTKLYEPWQGKIKASNYEVIAPEVQADKSMAVLTFNLVSSVGETTYKWNCTEVYRKEKGGEWKIIHSHWSSTKPELK
ncbi:MAG: nuclear transport factor 2 family protein [Prolixibacteraceae bacterium]